MSSAAKPAAKSTAKPSASAASAAKASSPAASSKPAAAKSTATKPAAAAAKSAPPAKTGAVKPAAAPSKAAAKAPSKAAVSPGSKAPAGAAKEPVKQLTEEEIRRAEEEAAARKAAEAAEHERRNGSVLLRYNHYKENFTLKDGTLTIPDVDDRFSLSFAFPKCKLHMTDQERSTVPNVAEVLLMKSFLPRAPLSLRRRCCHRVIAAEGAWVDGQRSSGRALCIVHVETKHNFCRMWKLEVGGGGFGGNRARCLIHSLSLLVCSIHSLPRQM
jgi:hypothetical protein